MDLLKDHKKDFIVDTPDIKISQATIEFRDTYLQVSNISSISVCLFPEKPYPPIAFILVLIGILALFAKMILPALFLIACGAALIYWIYSQNQNRSKYLTLQMNSGESYFFTCNETTFLDDIAYTLSCCIEFPSKIDNSITIDMSKCNINNSPFSLAKDNSSIMVK